MKDRHASNAALASPPQGMCQHRMHAWSKCPLNAVHVFQRRSTRPRSNTDDLHASSTAFMALSRTTCWATRSSEIGMVGVGNPTYNTEVTLWQTYERCGTGASLVSQNVTEGMCKRMQWYLWHRQNAGCFKHLTHNLVKGLYAFLAPSEISQCYPTRCEG